MMILVAVCSVQGITKTYSIRDGCGCVGRPAEPAHSELRNWRIPNCAIAREAWYSCFFWLENPHLGCLRSTKLYWVGKHIPGKYYYETDELPNPKIETKNGYWATFSHGKYFSWVGIGFIGNRLQKTFVTQPNCPQTP